jgi:hypothetical protein
VSVLVCQHHIFAAKFGQPDNVERLRQIMANLLRPRLPNLLPAQVLDAANRRVARVRACTMYHWPNDLADLAQTPPAGRPVGAGGAEESTTGSPILPAFALTGSPTWLIELARLLVLTRRSWIYFHLFTARRPGWTWAGPLVQIYLGHRPTYLLDATRDELMEMLQELQAASSAPSTSADLVVQCLRRLALAYPFWQGELAGFMAPTLGAYPALGLALHNLSKLVIAHYAPLQLAQVQLAAEVAPPPVGTSPLPMQLIAWLNQPLAAEFEEEKPPAFVIAALRARYPVPSPVTGDERVTPDELIEWVEARYELYDPRLTVAILLGVGRSLPVVLDDLLSYLPKPTDLPGGILDEVRSRLRHWQHYLSAYLAATPAAILASPDCTWMEIPASLRGDPNVQQRFANASALVLSHEFRELDAWPSITEPTELPVRAALVSVCLDHLFRDMGERYRRARRGT